MFCGQSRGFSYWVCCEKKGGVSLCLDGHSDRADIFGWAQVLKGMLYLYFPAIGLRQFARLTPGRANLFRLAGIPVLVLAALLTWHLIRSAGGRTRGPLYAAQKAWGKLVRGFHPRSRPCIWEMVLLRRSVSR